jgi:hypothetical protein
VEEIFVIGKTHVVSACSCVHLAVAFAGPRSYLVVTISFPSSALPPAAPTTHTRTNRHNQNHNTIRSIRINLPVNLRRRMRALRGLRCARPRPHPRVRSPRANHPWNDLPPLPRDPLFWQQTAHPAVMPLFWRRGRGGNEKVACGIMVPGKYEK